MENVPMEVTDWILLHHQRSIVKTSNIQFAARRAATVPFPIGLLALKLQVFILSGTVRCVHFTFILESQGNHFGVLGLHFGGF